MIDLGKAQVFEGTVAQELKEPGVRCLRRKVPGLDSDEDLAEIQPVHRAPRRGSGLAERESKAAKSLTRVDFRPSWAVT
jgi:hypothetical protein